VLNSLTRLLCCACLVAAFTAGVSAPLATAAPLGGGSSFSELTEGSSEPTETSTNKTGGQSSTSGSSSSTVLLLSLIAAGVLLAGIAFVILRDARRVAPVPDGQVGASGRPARDTAVQMRKRRARAKAARQQRKRNR
jgi:hypothetical protein